MRAPKIMTTLRWTLAAALGVAIGIGCAGKKASKDPAACMRKCEAECPYVPDGLGDNEEYLECLEACETKCS
jgi:hypothetical protein